jgi:hypothetical protein
MAVDIRSVLAAGGRPAIGLLEYCVASVQLEPVFVYLAVDYRYRPTAPRALALYDAFCAPGAAGRIRADSVLPPRSLRLAQEVARIRGWVQGADAPEGTPPQASTAIPVPARYLFDEVLALLTSGGHERVRHIEETWDPSLSAVENLPGGRMTAGQRMFVEKVWRPQLRPGLVQGGFPRIATIGG